MSHLSDSFCTPLPKLQFHELIDLPMREMNGNYTSKRPHCDTLSTDTHTSSHNHRMFALIAAKYPLLWLIFCPRFPWGACCLDSGELPLFLSASNGDVALLLKIYLPLCSLDAIFKLDPISLSICSALHTSCSFLFSNSSTYFKFSQHLPFLHSELALTPCLAISSQWQLN